MKEMKILLGGLYVGREFGLCDASNVDFGWIAKNPELLFFFDKIVMSKFALDSIKRIGAGIEDDVINECTQKLFSELDDLDCIDTDSVFSHIDDEKSFELFETIEGCRQKLEKEALCAGVLVCPSQEDMPGEVRINKCSYCAPGSRTILFKHALSKNTDITCLFDEYELNYLGSIQALGAVESQDAESAAIFKSVFEIIIPTLPLFPFTDPRTCTDKLCGNYKMCYPERTKEYSENINKFMQIYSSDELQAFKCHMKEYMNLYKYEENGHREKVVKHYEKIIKKDMVYTRAILSLAKGLTKYSGVASHAIASACSETMLGVISETIFKAVKPSINNWVKNCENKRPWIGLKRVYDKTK